MSSNQKYKSGERVCCIGDGLNIECIVLYDSLGDASNALGSSYWALDAVKVFDPITKKEIWISRSQLDYSKQYYRDKALKELGI